MSQDRDRRRAQTGPCVIDLPPGDYRWCGCGRSRSAPFCDGAPAQADCRALPFTVTRRVRTVWLCGCGQSEDKPYCDGSHNRRRG